jgi:cytochrome c nitrite reductase small subunit
VPEPTPPKPTGTQPRTPKRSWLDTLALVGFLPLATALVLGILGGVGTFTFGYGKGWAYLTNDPAACANCHVMQDHYDSWQSSSHKHVATCNDCHLPHNLPGKMFTKGDNGFFHSLAFTTGDYRDPIQIKRRNRKVTQGACLHCHQDIVHQMVAVGAPDAEDEAPSCIHCHSDVGHAHKARSGRGNDRFTE